VWLLGRSRVLIKEKLFQLEKIALVYSKLISGTSVNKIIACGGVSIQLLTITFWAQFRHSHKSMQNRQPLFLVAKASRKSEEKSEIE